MLVTAVDLCERKRRLLLPDFFNLVDLDEREKHILRAGEVVAKDDLFAPPLSRVKHLVVLLDMVVSLLERQYVGVEVVLAVVLRLVLDRRQLGAPGELLSAPLYVAVEFVHSARSAVAGLT